MRLDALQPEHLPVALGLITLTELLGEGPTGRVFLGNSAGDGGMPSEVVVTVLQPPSVWRPAPGGGDPLAGLRAARTIKHRGIVQVLAVGEADGLAYLVSERCDGVSVWEAMNRGAVLGARNALDIVIQCAAALAAAHEPGRWGGTGAMLHGDLRPSCLILGAEGVVKVRGFAMSHLALRESSGGKGWGGFASPEVLGGQPPAPQSDLFSLGVILYFCLTGRPPFQVSGESVSSGERIASIVKTLRAGQLPAQAESLVPGLGSVLGALLSLNPADRFGRAAELEAALREIRGALPPGQRLADWIRGIDSAPPELGLSTSDGNPPGRPLHPGAMSVPEATLDRPSLFPMRAPGEPAPPPVPVSSRPLQVAPRGTSTPCDTELPTDSSMSPRHNLTAPPARPPGSGPPGVSPGGPLGGSSVPSVPAGGLSEEELVTDPGVPVRQDPGDITLPELPTEDTDRVHRRQARSRSSRARRRVWLFAAIAMALGGTVGMGVLLLVSGDDPLWSPSERPDVAPGVPADRAGETGPDSGVVETEGPVPGGTVPGSEEPGALSPGQGGLATLPPGPASPDPETTAVPEREDRPSKPRPSTGKVRSPKKRTAASGGSGRGDVKASRLPPGSVTLSLKHKPITGGASGASDLVSVEVDGPPDTRVVLHSGPVGGPHSRTKLKGKKRSRWEGWLRFSVPAGETLEYWVVASHPAADRAASSGSAASPHQVPVR